MRGMLKKMAVVGTLAVLSVALFDSSAQACFGRKRCHRGCGRPVRVVSCAPVVAPSYGGWGGGYAYSRGYAGGMGYGGMGYRGAGGPFGMVQGVGQGAGNFVGGMFGR
jgi:hypothetical protein